MPLLSDFFRSPRFFNKNCLLPVVFSNNLRATSRGNGLSDKYQTPRYEKTLPHNSC